MVWLVKISDVLGKTCLTRRHQWMLNWTEIIWWSTFQLICFPTYVFYFSFRVSTVSCWRQHYRWVIRIDLEAIASVIFRRTLFVYPSTLESWDSERWNPVLQNHGLLLPAEWLIHVVRGQEQCTCTYHVFVKWVLQWNLGWSPVFLI